MEKRIISVFFVWRLILTLVVVAAVSLVPTTPTSRQFFPEALWQRGLPQWVWAWANFDGVHYVSIARNGYFFNQQPFFPLYPFVINLVNELLGFHRFLNGQIVSGQIVSAAAFILSLFIITKLVARDARSSLIPWVTGAMVFFPTAYSYTAVYNDSLFLFFACLTIFWARERRWRLAGVAGALATLTRLNGLALFFLILAEYAQVDWYVASWVSEARCAFSWERLCRSGILWFLAIPGVFLGYLFYVQRWFGSWQWVFTSMHTWGQDKLTFPLQVFWRYFKILLTDRSFSFTYWVAAMELGFVLFYLGLLLWSLKKIRVSYWIFFAVSILVPMLTGTFQGMPRYGLHLYPMYLVLGLVLARLPRLVSVGLLALGAVGQVVLLALFSRGWFVS